MRRPWHRVDHDRPGSETQHWKWVAAPTAALCAARAAREFVKLASVSACEPIDATDPVPPDASLIPKGKGWWCFRDLGADLGTQLKLGPPASTAHCVRTEKQCRRDHWGLTNDYQGVLTSGDDSGCVAAATAFVFTTNDGYKGAPTAADCDLDRHASAEHTACDKFH